MPELAAFLGQGLNFFPYFHADTLHSFHGKFYLWNQRIGLGEREELVRVHSGSHVRCKVVTTLYPLCKQRACITFTVVCYEYRRIPQWQKRKPKNNGPLDLTRILAALLFRRNFRSCPCEGSLSFLHKSFRC